MNEKDSKVEGGWKVINVKEDTHEKLSDLKRKLSFQLGQDFSYNEAIEYLIKLYNEGETK